MFNKLVYKIDIPQGNYVEQKQVSQLRVGMSPAQVKFVMGTPILVDPFSPHQWYYIRRIQKGNGPTTQKKLIINFKNNKVVSISGDFKPSDDFNTPITQLVAPQTSSTSSAD